MLVNFGEIKRDVPVVTQPGKEPEALTASGSVSHFTAET